MAEEDLFLSRMRALGVQPLEEKRWRQDSSQPEAGDLFDLDVEDTESKLFLEAMGSLGLATPRSGASEKETSPPEKQKKSWHLEAKLNSSNRPRSQEQDEEQQLFLKAIQELDHAPDKDKSPPPKEDVIKVRRLKAPRQTVVEPDDTLDLHRMKTKEALPLLKRFISRSHQQACQLLLVITGKGHHSPGGIPVLKREVEAWILREGKSFVQAFSEAAPSQGGRGALLLHLRPAKKKPGRSLSPT